MTSRETAREKVPAADRVLRMLSIVPWVAAHDGPRIDEVCTRFGVERKRLVEDLKVVQLVGLPPYTPDMLTEVTFAGGRVWVRLPDVFSRPLRLTPDQALSLVAAGSALTEAAGEGEQGPLETGLAKLAHMLGIEPAEAVSIRLGPSRPEVLRSAKEAVRHRQRVRLDYFTYGRDARSRREVDPYRVFSQAGAWYLYGHCHLAGEPRLFRLDRIFALELLEAQFDRPATADEVPDVYAADPDAPRVTLELRPPARWVVDQYPVEEASDLPGGGVRVRLAISSRPWLEKLLLRLGPDARLVTSTDPELRHAGAGAARRLLDRYRSVPGS